MLLVHYADLKREPEATIRRIAEFLDFDVPDAKWPSILEFTSFEWMKSNEDKFELRSVSDVPPLDPGAMLRKGKLGAERGGRDHARDLRRDRRRRPLDRHRPPSVPLELRGWSRLSRFAEDQP